MAGKANSRKKGDSPEVKKVLESLACDPVAGMAGIAKDEGVDVKLRAKLYMELAEYVYAKKKTVDTEDSESYEEQLRQVEDAK